MELLRITLFGDFEVRLGAGSPRGLRTRKSQALLAYLAVLPGRAHSRDRLATLLWGDRPPSQARARLRETLFVLRRAVAHSHPERLLTDGDSVVLSPDALDVDVVEFD